MKLWLLKNKDKLSKGDDPWEPWYDKCFGFVVRAETEEQARAHAHENAGEENRGRFLNKITANTNEPWINPKYSTCVELLNDGDAGIVIFDMHRS